MEAQKPIQRLIEHEMQLKVKKMESSQQQRISITRIGHGHQTRIQEKENGTTPVLTLKKTSGLSCN